MSVRPLAGALAGVALAVVACSDPFANQPQIAVATDSLALYAMTGTPAALPSALNMLAFQPVRMDGASEFDLAFDLDDAGNVIIYPVALVTVAQFRVGLRDTSAAFEEVAEAPRGTYAFEEPLVVPIGRTVIVEAQSSICQFGLSPFIYARLVVYAVDEAQRRISMALTVNPNCGFRTFLAEETPEN
ncbi:MAG TPA: hypothetical protein VMM18_11205 [Gemmatimonadaceae bacterium]|nr:hypothetical protein [Gemmatimonadaceae bacterium]